MKGQFVVNTARFRKRIGENVTRRAERITQSLVNGFIDRSPVWSGDFRASWNVSEGTPVYIERTDGKPDNPTAPPNFTVRARTQFPVFYITNGQPYAERLEYGWSHTQAPYGVVRITIAGMR